MDITDKIQQFIREQAEDENGNYVADELNIMSNIITFIGTLDDDVLDDESYNAMGSAYESMLDVLISLEDDDLDDHSSATLQQIFQEIEELEDDVEEAYKPRKRGRVKSAASRMTGAQKAKYIKRLKKNKKKYKTNATARRKAKKTGKKYRKTASGKRTIKLHKLLSR